MPVKGEALHIAEGLAGGNYLSLEWHFADSEREERSYPCVGVLKYANVETIQTPTSAIVHFLGAAWRAAGLEAGWFRLPNVYMPQRVVRVRGREGTAVIELQTSLLRIRCPSQVPLDWDTGRFLCNLYRDCPEQGPWSYNKELRDTPVGPAGWLLYMILRKLNKAPEVQASIGYGTFPYASASLCAALSALPHDKVAAGLVRTARALRRMGKEYELAGQLLGELVSELSGLFSDCPLNPSTVQLQSYYHLDHNYLATFNRRTA